MTFYKIRFIKAELNVKTVTFETLPVKNKIHFTREQLKAFTELNIP